jgi:aminoglycoside 3-N-acetyltransferase I
MTRDHSTETHCGPYTIQQLAANDSVLLLELMSVFEEAFEDSGTYGTARPGEIYLKSLLGGHSFAAFVAVCQGRIIGGLTAYLLPKPEQVRTEIYIYDLAVAAAHRRRGVATSLLRALMLFSRRIGATVAFVQADRDDAQAIALYEKLGTRTDVFHFDFEV